MGNATVEQLSQSDAENERSRLLESFNFTRDQLDRLANADALSPEEYKVLRRIRLLDWLLSESGGAVDS